MIEQMSACCHYEHPSVGDPFAELDCHAVGFSGVNGPLDVRGLDVPYSICRKSLGRRKVVPTTCRPAFSSRDCYRVQNYGVWYLREYLEFGALAFRQTELCQDRGLFGDRFRTVTDLRRRPGGGLSHRRQFGPDLAFAQRENAHQSVVRREQALPPLGVAGQRLSCVSDA